MQDLRKDAGQWLVMLRKQAGLSQSQLAKHLGVKFYTFISQVETGRAKVHPSQYDTWARAVNVDVKQFVLGLMKFYEPVTYDLLFRD
jgi:transcriptional regulator with XRE-family HTH domain